MSQLNSVTSIIADSILRSPEPININENEEITVLGHRGVWANKSEVLNWNGPVPINQYRLNDDPHPEVIHKSINQPVEYTQDIQVKYLRPPTPPPPGDLIIKQEGGVVLPPAPPQIIRQLAARPVTPEPIVIREAPPEPPVHIERKIVTIKGNSALDAPPRKVIIEKLPQLPAKPQPVIIERWLPYKEQKRRVIFQGTNQLSQPLTTQQTRILCNCACKCKCQQCKQELHCTCCMKEVQTAVQTGQITNVRNTIIQWSTPNPVIKKDIKYLGVVNADPREYAQKYGNQLKRSNELPSFVVELENNNGFRKYQREQGTAYELEGDIEALKYLDLDREGLQMYKHYLGRNSTSNLNSIGNVITNTVQEVHSNSGSHQPYFTQEHSRETVTRY